GSTKWSSFSPPWRITEHMPAGTGTRAGIWSATSSGLAPPGWSSPDPRPARRDRGDTRVTSRGGSRVPLGWAAARSVVFAVAVAVIGSLTPGYDPCSDPVSRLASPGEAWALEARVAFAAYGLLVLAGAGALRQYAGHRGHKLALCLTLYGVSCVVAGVAPK